MRRCGFLLLLITTSLLLSLSERTDAQLHESLLWYKTLRNFENDERMDNPSNASWPRPPLWSILEQLLNEKNKKQLGEECYGDLLLMREATTAFEEYLERGARPESAKKEQTDIFLRMLDASGHSMAGTLHGEAHFQGDYAECAAIGSHELHGRKRPIVAGFYRIFLTINVPDELSGKECFSFNDMVSLDACLPASCSSVNLLRSLSFDADKIDPLSPAFQPNMSTRHRNEDEKDALVCFVRGVNDSVSLRDWKCYFATFVIYGIIALCVASGVLDYYSRINSSCENSQRKRDFSSSVLSYFSMYENVVGIFREPPAQATEYICPADCIRCLSMCWVLSGHFFRFFLHHSGFRFDIARSTLQPIPMEIMSNAFLAVDTFFFLSGLLLGFLWFKAFKRNPTIATSPRAWTMFYIHRLLRLSPPYFAVLFFMAFIYKVDWLRDMPSLLAPWLEPNGCRQSWYAYVLYINNYVGQEYECMPWAWYLAAEMQMFAFSPLLLVVLARRPRAGLSLAATLLASSTAANFLMVFRFRFPASVDSVGHRDPEARVEELMNYGDYIYNNPAIRCQVYLMGIVVGFFLQMRLKPFRISLRAWLLLWTGALSTMCFVIFALHPFSDGTMMPRFWRAAYSSLSKPLWATGLTWIVVSSYSGFGGVIDAFMSWRGWLPLGRLSYCAYLIHVPIFTYLTGLTIHDLSYDSIAELFTSRMIPAIVITFALSIVWSACFEIPFSKITTAFLGGGRSGKKNEIGKNRAPHNRKLTLSSVWDSDDDKQNLL